MRNIVLYLRAMRNSAVSCFTAATSCFLLLHRGDLLLHRGDLLPGGKVLGDGDGAGGGPSAVLGRSGLDQRLVDLGDHDAHVSPRSPYNLARTKALRR